MKRHTFIALVLLIVITMLILLAPDGLPVASAQSKPVSIPSANHGLGKTAAVISDQWYSTLPNTAGSGLAVSRQNPLTAFSSGYNRPLA